MAISGWYDQFMLQSPTTNLITALLVTFVSGRDIDAGELFCKLGEGLMEIMWPRQQQGELISSSAMAMASSLHLLMRMCMDTLYLHPAIRSTHSLCKLFLCLRCASRACMCGSEALTRPRHRRTLEHSILRGAGDCICWSGAQGHHAGHIRRHHAHMTNLKIRKLYADSLPAAVALCVTESLGTVVPLYGVSCFSHHLHAPRRFDLECRGDSSVGDADL